MYGLFETIGVCDKLNIDLVVLLFDNLTSVSSFVSRRQGGKPVDPPFLFVKVASFW